MNLFLLFWWLLKWFWLYGLLYFHHECTPGDGDGQGGLACCDSCWATELNWTDTFIVFSLFPEWHQLFVLSIFFFSLYITIQRLLLPAPIGTNLFHRLLHGIILGIPFFFFFFLLNGQMFPWSYASPFFFFFFWFYYFTWWCTTPDTSWEWFWREHFFQSLNVLKRTLFCPHCGWLLGLM